MSSSEDTKSSSSSLKASKSKSKPKTASSPSQSKRNTLPLFGPGSDKTMALLKNLRTVAEPEPMLQLETELDSMPVNKVEAKLPDLQISSTMSCVSCQITFDNRDEQVQHFKTDWHRYNLKQRVKGAKYVTEMDFMERADNDNISSLSGSDSSSEESDDLLHADSGTLSSLPHQLPAKCGLDAGVESDDDEDDISEMVRYRNLVHGLAQSKIYLKSNTGQILSIYRAVICNKKYQIDGMEDLLQLIETLSKPSTWIVIMMGGGHFAAAVFNNGEVVAHKTFHRYVVRAKAGTSQSQHDKKGGHAQSAGAQIRRHNEAALTQDITELMKTWCEHFRKASRIFIRVATHNFPYIFSSKEKYHLNKSDQRICTIPFPTRRATFNEVKRVYNELISVHCQDFTPSKLSHASGSPTRARKSTHTNSSKPPPIRSRPKRQEDVEANSGGDEDDQIGSDLTYQEETISTGNLQQHERYVPSRQEVEEDRRQERKRRSKVTAQKDQTTPTENRKLLPYRSELYTACVTTEDSEELSALLDKYHQEICEAAGDFVSGINLPVNHQGQTLLHIACQHARPGLVEYLLNVGCDPAISDDKKLVPYLSTQNRKTRNVFRFFMDDNPAKYDYEKAQVPGPLSREQWQQKEAKDADRKKEVNKKKKEKLKIKKAETAKQREEEEEKKRFLNLSDQEKRALAAEKRLLEQAKAAGETSVILNRCYQCARDITGKVPFEYSSNTFCSPVCLKVHRFSLKAKS